MVSVLFKCTSYMYVKHHNTYTNMTHTHIIKYALLVLFDNQNDCPYPHVMSKFRSKLNKGYVRNPDKLKWKVVGRIKRTTT